MIRSIKWGALGFLAAAVAAASTPARANGLAVKNFRQVFDSLAVSTGVSPSDQAINDFYAQSYSRLPMTGSVTEVNSPALLTLTGLSGMFCNKMVVADSKLASAARRAHQAVDFTQGPAGLSSAIRQQTIEAYFGLFLSRSPSKEELAVIDGELDELAQNLGTKPADTLTALTAACTTVASSLDSLIL